MTILASIWLALVALGVAYLLYRHVSKAEWKSILRGVAFGVGIAVVAIVTGIALGEVLDVLFGGE